MIYKTGGGWGNAINWTSWEKRKVVGWKPRKPHVGDLLEANMESGRVYVLRFVKVELCGDPQDMFFATVEDVGFKDELGD